MAEGSLAHVQQDLLPCVHGATSVGHCGRTLCRNPSSRAISSPSLIWDVHLRSLSHSAAHPTHPLNLCVSQSDFEKGQFLQFNHDVQSRLQGLLGRVRVCTLATWLGARVQTTVARFSSPHAVARAQVLHGTEALPGTIRRTTRKKGLRNKRRLSSTFAFAAVPASFAVSVGLPLLSKEGFRAKPAKLCLFWRFLRSARRDDLEGLLSCDIDHWSEFLFLSCWKLAFGRGRESP